MYIAIILIGLTGSVAACVLYFLSKKFEVNEDPRIAQVSKTLPGANCGACGYPGCRGFAVACVKAATLKGLSCPVGGADVMKHITAILGQDTYEYYVKVAILRCNGNSNVRTRTNIYDGAKSCAVAASHYSGETACPYGCLGWGDCATACTFGAIHVNPATGLPEISDEKCVACGACVKACPKKIIEMRNKGPKSRRIFVACSSKDKGGVARKACQNACTGCTRCVKECTFDAITIMQNLARIDETKCRLCRKCVPVCPSGSIQELNFPIRKITLTESSPINH